FGARRADIAGEGIALAHDWVDHDRNTVGPGERSGSLQSPRVRRGYDSRDPVTGQILHRLGRLSMSERGQGWIPEARIGGGGGEMQVEFALAVPQQDHERAIQANFVPGNPPVCEKYLCNWRHTLIS